jgi:propionate CoA-transferase
MGEIALGVDLDRDVLNKMEFQPIISRSLMEIDKMLFVEQNMGIRKAILDTLPRKRSLRDLSL